MQTEIEVADEIASYGPRAVARYQQWCETNGGPPQDNFQATLAICYARQRGVNIGGTDAQWFKGIGTKDPFGKMPNFVREEMWRRAEAQGINMNGKEYNYSLVRKEYADAGLLDPEAVVDSVGDVRRVLESRPYASADGMVNQTGRQLEDDPDFTYRASEEMVDEAVEDEFLDAGIDRCSVKEFESRKAEIKEKIEGDMNS